MNAFFCATASCLPTGRPHWTRSVDHSRAIFVAHLAWPTQIAGSARRPVFSVRQGDLEPPALLADQVLGRHEDVLELGHRVLDALQAHELVAVQDADAFGLVVEHEGADAALVTVGLRHPRHHDDDVGDHAVGRPQLGAVEDVAAVDRLGARGHARGIGADVGLGQQERRDVGARHAREPLALLLVGAEHPQRLGHADRLVGRDERAERAVPGADHRQRAVVVDLREPEAVVLLGHLHAHRADALEALDDLVRDLGVALDLQRVDLVREELAQRGEETLALLGRLGVEPRLRVDQVEPVVAEEELLAEARQLPILLAGGLGDLPCLLLGDVRGGHDLLPGVVSAVMSHTSSRSRVLAVAVTALASWGARSWPRRILIPPRPVLRASATASSRVSGTAGTTSSITRSTST